MPQKFTPHASNFLFKYFVPVVSFLLIVAFLTFKLGQHIPLIKATLGWESFDLNADGQIDAADIGIAIPYLGCPESSTCPNFQISPTPSATTPCEEAVFGTQIISDASALFIKNLNLHQKGYVFTGSPYRAINFDPDPNSQFGYQDLTGWHRGFVEGVMANLENKTASANSAGLGNEYEFLAYGPESLHQAGEEALWPDINVPIVEGWAHAAGKLLMYAPSRQDYEVFIPAARPDINPQHLIADVALHVDYWGLQLGFLQGHVDTNQMSEAEFTDWFNQWVSWIKVGDPASGHPGNPHTKIVVQIGIAKYDKATETCLPPESVEYLLQWRERLVAHAASIILMPSQQCQPCPPNPPPGFICTTNPEFIDNYNQSFDNAVQAAATICTP